MAGPTDQRKYGSNQLDSRTGARLVRQNVRAEVRSCLRPGSYRNELSVGGRLGFVARVLGLVLGRSFAWFGCVRFPDQCEHFTCVPQFFNVDFVYSSLSLGGLRYARKPQLQCPVPPLRPGQLHLFLRKNSLLTEGLVMLVACRPERRNQTRPQINRPQGWSANSCKVGCCTRPYNLQN